MEGLVARVCNARGSHAHCLPTPCLGITTRGDSRGAHRGCICFYNFWSLDTLVKYFEEDRWKFFSFVEYVMDFHVVNNRIAIVEWLPDVLAIISDDHEAVILTLT